MIDKISTRKACLLIIEPLQVRRTMLIEGFKELGFREVKGAASAQDAVQFMESGESIPDWIITGIFPLEAINGIHILALTIKEPTLRKARTMVSFITDTQDLPLMINAFEMGLFSAHPKGSDMMTQMAEFANLFAIHAENDHDNVLTAAHYLRGFLQQQNLADELARLEKALLTIYPDNAGLKFHLAAAMHQQGKSTQALRLLSSGVNSCARLRQAAETLSREIISATSGPGGDAMNINATCGIRRALVIDSDGAMQNLGRDTLLELGVNEVDVASDGEQAWAILNAQNLTDSGQIDLILQEWRLGKIPGPVLAQKVRGLKGASAKLAQIPIIVFSSLVKTGDRFALREMGITEVIEKPQTKKKLAALIFGALKEVMQLKSEKAFDRQIRLALHAKDMRKAKELFTQMLAEQKVAEGIKQRFEAEFAFAEGRLREANELAISALHGGGEDIFLLNLLGKIYLKLKQYQQAQQFFNKAQELSPVNVERLCNLAETQLALDDVSHAATTLAQAKSIDADAQAVKETEIKVALMQGDIAESKNLMSMLGESTGVVAFLNNKGVMLVEQGRVEESIKLYIKALKAIPVDQENWRSLVRYNMGLAFIKVGNLSSASKCLEAALLQNNSPVFAKAKSLLAKTKKSLETGVPVTLTRDIKELGSFPEQVPQRAREDDDGEPIEAVGDRGELRCHLIYESSIGMVTAYRKLLDNMPRFSSRHAVKKGGAEARKVGAKKRRKS
jgi:tetratricopeptide (TPR) repeat protein